jgi:acetyltransferase-like isoleucine patch superfamily enzyme
LGTTARTTLQKIRGNPILAAEVAVALAKGFLVKLRFLFNPRVRIGPDFRAYTVPRIIGPGRVVIGAHVDMRRGFLRRPCILTHSKEALVTIGSRSILGGTRISCVDSVWIGEEALLGSSTIIDSDVIPYAELIQDGRWRGERVRPVSIGERVWSGINSFILAGAVVGDECAIAAGAVVYGGCAPERSLLVGNPARRIGETRPA